MMPWKLMASMGAYIFTWLIGYSGLMGAIAGILICDYWVIRKQRLNLAGLFDTERTILLRQRVSTGGRWLRLLSLSLRLFLASSGQQPHRAVRSLIQTSSTPCTLTHGSLLLALDSAYTMC